MIFHHFHDERGTFCSLGGNCFDCSFCCFSSYSIDLVRFKNIYFFTINLSSNTYSIYTDSIRMNRICLNCLLLYKNNQRLVPIKHGLKMPKWSFVLLVVVHFKNSTDLLYSIHTGLQEDKAFFYLSLLLSVFK